MDLIYVARLQTSSGTPSYHNGLGYLSGEWPDLFNSLLRFFANNIKNEVFLLSSGKCKKTNKYKYNYQLPYGRHKVKYNDQDLTILYKREKELSVDHSIAFIESIKINFSKGVTKAQLEELYDKALEYCKPEKTDGKVNVYTSDGGYWELLSSLSKRTMDTIYLSIEKKEALIKDIDKWIERESFYKPKGIPYKRIYLLEGPPGTGKTSLVFAIASKYDKSISILNFGMKMDDQHFMHVVSNMKENSILLLEDIDCLFVQRKAHDDGKNMISFSGILNVLDGVGRKEPMMVFMSTNHKERLDPAFIRPGRVDMIINFDYAKEPEIRQMFMNLMPAQEKNLDNFLKKIRHLKLTMAYIQKFIVDNLDCENILDKISYLEGICTQHSKEDKIPGMYL
jgi:chaperone BCS1